MGNKTIIITGAGFSAPANIPIQNKILDEMIKQEDNILDISQSNIELDNEKYLDSFVRVGLYLLTNYCAISDELIANKFDNISNADLANRYIYAQKSSDRAMFYQGLLKKIDLLQNDDKVMVKQLLLNLEPSLDGYFDEYFTEMLYLKGEIKRKLSSCQIKVSLEDVFTAFDKAISLKSHTKHFTYHEEDDVKHAILRLFIYYFGKILKNHNYASPKYVPFVDFVKNHRRNCSIITTNWDTLIEGYFSANSILYELCLNNVYYKYDDDEKNPPKDKGPQTIKLIKLHGSINWFRCLQCGDMSIIEKNPCGEYLFSTESKEQCLNCGNESRNNALLLQPEIITPTMVKSFDGQLYKNLWASAADELRNAKRIVFVGYSLPTADFELKYFLQNNIPPTSKIDVVLYHNDDPAQLSENQRHLEYLLPQKRYNDVFVKNTINYYYEGFEEYFKNSKV